MPVVVVATKVDKLNREDARSATQRMQRSFGAAVPADEEAGAEEGAVVTTDKLPVILFSSVTGLGKGDLWKAIRDNILS